VCNSIQIQNSRLVAVANLSVGVLGILCYWIRGNFWVATVIGFSIWWLGAGAVHIREIVASANYAPKNAGATPYMDILVPIVLIALLAFDWVSIREKHYG